MNKKCPMCQQQYTKDYDECIICNVALVYENNQMPQGRTIINRANRNPIVSPNMQNNNGYSNDINNQNNSPDSNMYSGDYQGDPSNEGRISYTYQGTRNGNIQGSYTKKDNVFIRIFRSIGIAVTNIFNFILRILKSLFKSSNSIFCKGIIVSSISTDKEEYSTTERILRGLFLGIPFSKDGSVATFQICEVDSAGRPIRNKGYSVRVYGNIMNGQLLTNNEVEISGFRDSNGEIVANKIINLNSNVIVKPNRSINMIAVRNVLIAFILCIVMMSVIKVPVSQKSQGMQTNQVTQQMQTNEVPQQTNSDAQQGQTNEVVQETKKMSIFETIMANVIEGLTGLVTAILEGAAVILICVYGFKLLFKKLH